MRFEPIEQRLEKHTIPEPNSGCLIWLGSTTDGYGRIGIGRSRRTRGAHIVAYELANGPVPEGLQLDHKCRVRCCVNPDHLEPVTQQVNIGRGANVGLKKFFCDDCGSPYEVLQSNPRQIRGCRSCANKHRRDKRKCYQ
jgi:hypothetical protein